ncbi:NAD-dependent epimerase/dehydratase family protein [Naasia aerilata]|uniref:3-beta hydroxysteroid dehydrogenase n=1 Tax=Naasia aerilata TaxID=1162966 RepID=A0ABM8G9M2_9MICO|nr:NAD-dependent epimerase/dehydratase family protein [Naasia aerilata]BDZ44882.1 3-beta hydroxysteroid dehydrogenase [Naasia aerilata]
MNAFVTGGSGFIGRRLIARLVEDGVEVHALARSERAATAVRQAGAVALRGDLTDGPGLLEALAGMDVVFHLAAETDVLAPAEQHRRVTVDGTRAIVEAARAAGVPRFVHCGTEAALLAGAPLVDANEDAPLRPDSPAAYSASKAVAEQIVRDANAPDFATVVIRPRFVWGPDSSLIGAFAAAAEAGQLPWISGGHHLSDVTHVDNAVEGLILGWRRGLPGEAYFITDQERVDLRDFVSLLLELAGAPVPVLEIDGPTADATVPVPIRWFLGQPCTLRTDKAVRELGYAPVTTHQAGIAALRARGGQPAGTSASSSAGAM